MILGYLEEAIEELKRLSDIQFDKDIVNAFISCLRSKEIEE